MGIDPILQKFLEHGILGLIAALAIFVAWKKDRMVHALQDRLIEKTEKDADKYYQFATEMNNTMKALTNAVIDDRRQIQRDINPRR